MTREEALDLQATANGILAQAIAERSRIGAPLVERAVPGESGPFWSVSRWASLRCRPRSTARHCGTRCRTKAKDDRGLAPELLTLVRITLAAGPHLRPNRESSAPPVPRWARSAFSQIQPIC